MPIIEKYQKLGLVRKILATPGPDEVSALMEIKFKSLRCAVQLIPSKDK